ncbi:uncharacterized protein BJ171DRAFT_511091 [Polychytrium aggregatum]|uniref:uncharacterized protein n=1 Tax=Polychytrium aggregatum TaxID=110093 RepID=UPI0022FE0C73|nr:uncharacterized protein BJ171DRAFT_511091 [Polychytrium aggregatum]KAI9203188.1 hypothetical protein BJ171DRAFT_511091 [Polychytrium aggregatum]
MVVKPVVESTRPPPKLLSLEPPPPPPATPANLGYDWYYTDGDSALAMHPGVETPAPSVSSLQGTVAGTTAAPQASSEPPETMDVVQGLILNDRRRSMMGIRPITPHQYMSDLPAPTIPLHGPVDVAVLQESEKETIARRMSLIAEKRPPTAQRHQTMQARPCSGVQRERQRSIVKPHDPRPIIPEVPAEDERASSVLPSALAIVRRQLYLIGYAIVAIQRAWRHFATVRKRMFYHDAATFIQRHYRYWKLARYYREMMKSMTGDASFDFDHSLSTWSQLNHTVRERETDSLTNIKFRRFRVYIRTRKEASKPVIHHIDGRAADVGVAGDVDGGTEGLTNAAALQDTQHMDSSDNSGAIPSQLEHTVQDAGEIELVWGLVGLWSTAFDCGSLPKEDRLLLGMASDTRHDHDHVRFHDDFHAPGQRSVHTTDSKTGDIITADSRRPSKVAMERRRSSVSSRRSNQTHSEDTDLEPTTHSPMGSTHKMVSRNESNSVPGKSSRRASVVKPGYKRQRSFSVGSDPRKGDTEPSSEAAADIARERFKRSRQPSKESDNSSQLTDATAEARNSAVERRHQRSHSMVEYSPSYSKFTAAHGLSGIQDIGDDAESDSLNGTIISENSSEYQWNSWYGHSKSVAPPAPPKRSVLHHPFHHGLMHLVPAQAVVEVLRGLVQIAGADVRLNLGGDPLDGSFEKSLRDLGWESRQERSRSSSARQGCRSGRASIAKPG